MKFMKRKMYVCIGGRINLSVHQKKKKKSELLFLLSPTSCHTRNNFDMRYEEEIIGNRYFCTLDDNRKNNAGVVPAYIHAYSMARGYC